VRLVTDVAEQTYGKAPVLEPLSPAVGSRSVLNWSGQPVIGFGIAYPGSNIQAPNEHIRLSDFENGVAFYTELLLAFANEGPTPGGAS
jgi:acetylornithine deacetylase/succinyl-diaminopimelate desuccinylase-like protein